MFTRREWEEFLYSCDLVGRLWLRVDRIAGAYICWRTGMKTAPFDPSPRHDEAQKMMDAFSLAPGGSRTKIGRPLERA